MFHSLGTLIIGLVGLAFGALLNACLDLWAARAHRTNPALDRPVSDDAVRWRGLLPLTTWFAPSRTPGTASRYMLVELAVGASWAVAAWQSLPAFYLPGWTRISIFDSVVFGVVKMILCWLLVGLAVLDAGYLWLPDWFTLGGAALGLLFSIGRFAVHWIWETIPLHWATASGLASHRSHLYNAVFRWVVSILAALALVLLTRWSYRRIREQEGVRLGETKLLLLLAVWMGLWHTVVAAVLGIVAATVFALIFAARRRARLRLTALPLGTFLCIGGILSGLWGGTIIAAYLRWCGFE
jgi:leader peptidase (prepilin peptidase) / N-methyltransferase